ncbi:hypothetical protein WA026_012672 [Henosepilachna vigintioctopunctata]|uniref:Protein quiver n=1 Tax=Henosepilachna vigintioctopunctata TaxID=420089 RepID=A0AAW1U6X5_9CUCU
MTPKRSLFFAVIWITLTHVPSNAIKCYKCSLTKTNIYLKETIGLCADFDYSDRFKVNCPNSTFCVKKSYKAKIAGLINGTERFCAYQTFETHKIVNREWIPTVIIEEPYSENCTTINDQGLKTGWTEECYCKTELCNGAKSHNGARQYPILLFLFAVVIFIKISLIL